MRAIIASLLVLTTLLAGCGIGSKSKASSSNSEASASKSENKETSKGQNAPTVTAKDTFPEITFNRIRWYSREPAPQKTGGVWVYTKDKHPGNMSDSLDFEKNDVVLVQISDTAYKGYEMEPVGVQVMDNDVIRFVLRPIKPEKDEPDAEAARCWISVEKGKLDGKKFQVVDDEYKPLKVD